MLQYAVCLYAHVHREPFSSHYIVNTGRMAVVVDDWPLQKQDHSTDAPQVVGQVVLLHRKHILSFEVKLNNSIQTLTRRSI